MKMSEPNRAHRVQQLFHAAVEITDPDERTEFLRGRCNGDSELRREVESLLAADDRENSVLERPMAPGVDLDALWVSASAKEPDSASGHSLPDIPGYQIIEQIGYGGMGVVYKAQDEKLSRVVALKMVLAGQFATPEQKNRFRAEAGALARLQHPNIVQIFEIGEHGGLPFLAIEFVDGQRLDQKLGRDPHNPHATAKLVGVLAQAMHQAHQQGVIHRDLKPANVLLSNDGTPKITDFGLAKMLDASVAATQSGAIMGTPSYMSPEQAAGKTKEVGPASDNYSLGAILYDMLTGRPPFQSDSTVETLRQVTDIEPVSPSRLQPKLPRDLNTICLKCLHKEPRKRYATAQELADDLDRFLRGAPIKARPVGNTERLWKLVKRRPVVAGLIAALAILMVASTITSLALAQWALDERDSAIVSEQRAKAALEHAQIQNYGFKIAQVQRKWNAHRGPEAWFHLENTLPKFRDWEYRYLRALFEKNQLILRGHKKDVVAVAFIFGGQQLASASLDGTVRLWDAASGKELRVLKYPDQVLALAVSADGKMLAIALKDKTIRLWNSMSGKETSLPKAHTGDVSAMAFSPDGKRLVSASHDGAARIWDTNSGEEPQKTYVHTQGIYGVAFSPDGRRIVIGSSDHTVRIWNTDTNKQEAHALQEHPDWVWAVIFSPNGKLLASGCDDTLVRLWDFENEKVLAELPGHSDPVRAIDFDRNGKQLASASNDGSIRLWDVQKPKLVHIYKGHTAKVNGVAFSPDGKHLASGSADKTVRLWRVQAEAPPVIRLMQNNTYVLPLAFSADGKYLAGRADDKTVRHWDMDTRREVVLPQRHKNKIVSAAFSPDGKRLASASKDGTILLWDGHHMHRSVVLKSNLVRVGSMAFSPGGNLLASGHHDGKLRLWDIENRQELFAWKGHSAAVAALAFSPDGKQLASGGDDKVGLWDGTTGKEIGFLKGHTDQVWALTYSADGKRLASGSVDKTVRMWNVATGKMTLVLKGHTRDILALAFSRDGRRLASASYDKTVRLWDVEHGVETLLLRGHASTVSAIAFSKDGNRLASASWDPIVRIWEAPAHYSR